MPYSLEDASKILGVSKMTLRRRIKAGTLDAELVDGPFGPQYMIPETAIHPITEVAQVVKVSKELDIDQLEQAMQRLINNELAQMIREGIRSEQTITTESIDLLKAEIVELKEIILENQRNWMESRQEKLPWWRRIFKRGGE